MLKPAAAAFAALSLLASPAAEARKPQGPVVIGYVAAFRDMKATMEMTDLKKLTHINISFVNPGKDGSIVTGDKMSCMDTDNGNGNGTRSVAEVREIVQMAHAKGVKVLVSLGGGIIPGCSGNWTELTRPGAREKLVADLLAFADATGLDGIDVDLEWDVLTAIDKEGNYVPFTQALRTGLTKRRKLLTCATASNPGGMIPVGSIPHFDYINLMSYDQIGETWGKAGAEHSTMEVARKDIATWKALGAKKEQLTLGVPFYGRGFNGYKGGYSFQKVLTTFGKDAANYDVVGKACAGCDYVTYNGRPTIRAKAALAAKETAGIMIWELSEDAPAPNSLLEAAHDSLHNPD
ncbi:MULTISPECIES: glycosyl hydrolase family 18 protein [Asticcacaulis]|uniref:glycosyl hydrolase family 18 protein n=1 Tax=Asticcacaulis TaxID=76890 RepID=UPI001FD946D1|nr:MULTISPECIES: glycosyl hydrolase family 18 protein [Asticcacaulis]MBP2161546.1 GH18 family chitinase [Asticcacaulis solisilvae]MDR6802603.1 GH18 family chitinase [Asticcacaulis sp. BE141]